MNMATGVEAPAGDIGRRKQDHLALCGDPEAHLESTESAWFDKVRFVHTSLPELDFTALDTSCAFLGKRLSFPFLISSMTGGSRDALSFNRELARAAQETGVAVGLGSVRIALERPDTLADFQIRTLAPDVPVFANLSAVQLRDTDHGRILELLDNLQVDALAVHCNPGQELMQPGGDRDFRGLLDAIRAFIAASPFPVIVKETGFGIRPSLGRLLLEAGAAYVDLAGGGGTNWMLVDAARDPGRYAEEAEPFRDWGLPAALLLEAWPDHGGRVIASGGIRDGVALAKAVAMGAGLGGAALPFVRVVLDGGAEAAITLIRRYRLQFATAMLLAGAGTMEALARVPLLKDRTLIDRAAALVALEARDVR